MCNTLIELIQLRSTTSDSGITFVESGSQENYLSYRELYDSSLSVLGHLQTHGILAGEELVFQIEDNRTFIIVFWACLLGGIIPVPLTIGNNNDHKQKLFNIWKILNKPCLISTRHQLSKIQQFSDQHDDLYQGPDEDSFLDIDHIFNGDIDGDIFSAKNSSLAFIQFSSGSTGTPKGVQLTHENLLTNIDSISKAGQYSKKDSMLSWMPLTHDMGLIGFHLNPLFCGMHHFIIPTNLFIRRPSIWLDKASEHSISVLCSPNFGYKYIIKHCHDLSKYDWDLSTVRILYNGAEPISEKLSTDFLDHLTTKGLNRNAMCPVYGLAEASLAVSMTHLGDQVISCSLNRKYLNINDQIVFSDDENDAVSFVNVGRSVENCFIKITNESGGEVDDQIIGHVEISGKNVTSGYYNNPDATNHALTSEQWLRTGDLGFIKDDCLYITGRAKDILFVNGQNFYPHDLERVAEEIDGIELNKIAVAGWYNQEQQQEEVIAFVFHRGKLSNFIELYNKLRSHLNTITGLHLDRIIPTKDIPRTTSGKLQRFKLLERFKEGKFNEIENQLAALIQSQVNDDIELPVNELEQRLLNIWKKTLGLDQLGVTQGFYEIGGNSLKAAEIMMLIVKEFDVELPSTIFYKNPTIRELVEHIEDLEKTHYEPITKSDALDHYPLSPLQKRLYYAWEMDKEGLSYNLPVAFVLKGTVDISKIEQAFKSLVSSYDALRMHFDMLDEPQFKISERVDFKMDIDRCYESEIDINLKNSVRPFDLKSGPLFRSKVILVKEDYNILFIDFHHIISDGLSIYNFVTSLLSLYAGAPQLESGASYSDFIPWEKRLLKSNRVQSQADFWLESLKGDLPLLDMPSDQARPSIFKSPGETIQFSVDDKLTRKLKILANDNKSTLHALIFTTYYLLLSKYTRQNEMIVGIPIAGRRHADLRRSFGMFVNNLPVKCNSNPKQLFSDLLKSFQSHLLNCFDNQDYPFALLIDQLDHKRDASRNPIFDTMFNYQNMGLPKNFTDDFSIERYFFNPGFSKFDLSMEVFEEQDELTYTIEYATHLFEKHSILKLQEYFNNLLESIAYNPDCKLADLSLISEEENVISIHDFNDTQKQYPRDSTVHELFRQQVIKTPTSVAIDCNGTSTTYQELDIDTNNFAYNLMITGVQANDVVGVLLPRSKEFVTAILSVLKSGGAYLPIDIDLPKERIKYILKQSKCKKLITNSDQIGRLEEMRNDQQEFPTILNIDMEITNKEEAYIQNVNVSSDLAYVIYTSGTTGRPKGVMVEHQSLINYVSWASEKYLPEGAGSFPLYTSISFDLTITSIFTPLLTGNRVVVYPENDQEVQILNIVSDSSVDVVKLTPSHLRIINNQFDSPVSSKIQSFIVGGEDLDTKLAKDIYDKFGGNVRIFNEYGPTEATIGCMIHEYEPKTTTVSVPIGVPAYNTQIYILDEFLKPVATNVKGDVYISGDGLARGYLYNHELTEEKFIDNPFVHGSRMYKSGDMAKRLASGVVQFLGRSDQQIKINGYRIELSEIEGALLGHPQIEQAVIGYNENTKSLHAYYTNKSSEIIGPSALRTYLANSLPHYMIPVSFTLIKEIPLTKNGKVNYERLLQIETIDQNVEKTLPKNKIEETLVKIWQEVLEVSSISIEDNFFELGGDSIKAVQISSRLKGFGIIVKVKDILTYHTLHEISNRASTIGKLTDIYEQGVMEGSLRLLPINLWFTGQKMSHPEFYNQSLLLSITSDVDIDIMEKAFDYLIRHHDMLRLNLEEGTTNFYYNKDHLKKVFKIDQLSCDFDPRVRPNSLEKSLYDIKSSFDLSNDLLIKAVNVNTPNGERYLFMTAHHLLVDGMSWRILLEDLYSVYKLLINNEPVRLSHKTGNLNMFHDELKRKEDLFKTYREYWRAIESYDFYLPLDNVIDSWKISDVSTISKVLGAEETTFLLKKAHIAYKTNVPIILNVALALTLQEWTGSDKLVVEQENHGRHLDEIDTSRSIGWFTAMYPILMELKGNSISGTIKSIKEQFKQTPDNGLGYGVNKYLKHVSSEKSGEMSEVRFNYLGQFGQELNNDLFSFNSIPHGKETHDDNAMTTKLEFNLLVIDNELKVDVIYNSSAHYSTTIHRVLDRYFYYLKEVLDHISNQEDVHFTSSDFEEVHLNEEELDALF